MRDFFISDGLPQGRIGDKEINDTKTTAMKKYILLVLLLGGTFPVFADISDRGRPWDIPGYHDGGTWGLAFPFNHHRPDIHFPRRQKGRVERNTHVRLQSEKKSVSFNTYFQRKLCSLTGIWTIAGIIVRRRCTGIHVCIMSQDIYGRGLFAYTHDNRLSRPPESVICR